MLSPQAGTILRLEVGPRNAVLSLRTCALEDWQGRGPLAAPAGRHVPAVTTAQALAGGCGTHVIELPTVPLRPAGGLETCVEAPKSSGDTTGRDGAVFAHPGHRHRHQHRHAAGTLQREGKPATVHTYYGMPPLKEPFLYMETAFVLTCFLLQLLRKAIAHLGAAPQPAAPCCLSTSHPRPLTLSAAPHPCSCSLTLAPGSLAAYLVRACSGHWRAAPERLLAARARPRHCGAAL